MIKARFAREQPEVNIITIEGKHYIYVCRNGERKQEIFENGREKEIVNYWEYDYYEFTESAELITREEIEQNIDEYIKNA